MGWNGDAMYSKYYWKVNDNNNGDNYRIIVEENGEQCIIMIE